MAALVDQTPTKAEEAANIFAPDTSTDVQYSDPNFAIANNKVIIYVIGINFVIAVVGF